MPIKPAESNNARRQLKYQASRKALDEMALPQQRVVKRLMRQMQSRVPKFGQRAAIETLSELGMFLNEMGIDDWSQIKKEA